MRSFALSAILIFFFSSSAQALEPDLCLSPLSKMSIKVKNGTEQETQQTLNACAKTLFERVKAKADKRVESIYRPGFEIVKWRYGSTWTTARCYMNDGQVLVHLVTYSPVDDQACLAQTLISKYLGDAIARD